MDSNRKLVHVHGEGTLGDGPFSRGVLGDRPDTRKFEEVKLEIDGCHLFKDDRSQLVGRPLYSLAIVQD